MANVTVGSCLWSVVVRIRPTVKDPWVFSGPPSIVAADTADQARSIARLANPELTKGEAENLASIGVKNISADHTFPS